MITGPFSPGRSYTLEVTSASVSVPIDPDASSLRLVNGGTELMFVRVGVGAQVALIGDFVLVPNVAVTITKGVGTNTLAAIGGAVGPEPLYATTGEGL